MTTIFDPADVAGELTVGIPDTPNVTVGPPPGHPSEVAEQLRPVFQDADGNDCLINRDGVWHQYADNRWRERTEDEVFDLIHAELCNWYYTKRDPKTGELLKDPNTDQPKLFWFNPTTRSVNEARRALRVLTNRSMQLGHDVVDRMWLDGRPAGPVMSFRNGLMPLDGSRSLYGHTPLWFAQSCVPYDYDRNAPEPAEWLAFLQTLWGDSPESIDCLQEMFGYFVSGRLDLHVFLLLNGPRRSGKGVILETLSLLLGDDNVAGLNLEDFEKNFGLEGLIGKLAGVVGDARLSRGNHANLLERLLTISAGDRVQVDRKFRKPWTGKLSARIAIASNNPLDIHDESGALAARTILLRTTKTFAGREDRGLKDRIARELSGILNWALDGLDRLNANGGRFTKPKQSARMEKMVQRATSPLASFLADWCELGEAHKTKKDELYDCYEQWCEKNKIEHVLSPNRFGMKLLSTGANIDQSRPKIDGKRVYVYEGVKIRALKDFNGKYQDPPDNGEDDDAF